MIRRPPRSTQGVSSAASDVYKRQGINAEYMGISCDCNHNHSYENNKQTCEYSHDYSHAPNEEACTCGHDHSHNENSEEVNRELKIRAKIRSFGAWAQVMPESFVVKSTLSTKEMYEQLTSVSISSDILLVTKIDTTDIAYTNQALIDWLIQYL
eukprot:TRINITY_DN35825_c0_g1_i2.p1 TRINITY_DN35825_c0_g1~~TRINITY_DN35825_c0_g1_i2.p1  ORF type:complete len:154 (-),score=24.45 TRINITY_DN35825_c0_g1_i2:237-698(-)